MKFGNPSHSPQASPAISSISGHHLHLRHRKYIAAPPSSPPTTTSTETFVNLAGIPISISSNSHHLHQHSGHILLTRRNTASSLAFSDIVIFAEARRLRRTLPANTVKEPDKVIDKPDKIILDGSYITNPTADEASTATAGTTAAAPAEAQRHRRRSTVRRRQRLRCGATEHRRPAQTARGGARSQRHKRRDAAGHRHPAASQP